MMASSFIKSLLRFLFTIAAVSFIVNQTVIIFHSPADHSDLRDADLRFQNPVTASKSWLVYANKSGCGKAIPFRLDSEKRTPLPPIALLSAQGSGNTWLRWLIERLTGVCTGSLYKEKAIVASSGFRCEVTSPTNGMSIVQKTHYIEHFQTDKVLLLVRNPLDAIVSDYHRICTSGNHTGQTNDENFSGIAWNNFVITRSGEWFQQILKAFNRSAEIHVVFYENLQTNLIRELKSVAEFLRVYVSRDRLDCVYNNRHGTMRRQSKGKGRAYYTPFDLDLVSVLLARAVALFQDKKIPNIPVEYLNVASRVKLQLAGEK